MNCYINKKKRLINKERIKRLSFFDIRRIAVELIASVIISWVLTILIKGSRNIVFSIEGFSYTALILVFLCEGIFMFDAFISRKYPWHLAVKKRVITLFIFALLWLFTVGKLSHYIGGLFFDHHAPPEKFALQIGLVIFIFFTIIYVVALIGYNFHITLEKFVVENERLNREKLEMDYFALQDQLNPHFLFNNLSTLMALISQDPPKAEKFAADFTDVYRYVLMSSRFKVINLAQEKEFIHAYINIHQQRLGGGLNVKIEIPSEYLCKKIPPLSLQFLVENAIKHNIATEQRPLNINIAIEDERLAVVNNLQPKISTYSTNTGLGNLYRRYKYLIGRQGVEVYTDDSSFKVTIPLLS